jgi:hypothetical protein
VVSLDTEVVRGNLKVDTEVGNLKFDTEVGNLKFELVSKSTVSKIPVWSFYVGGIVFYSGSI